MSSILDSTKTSKTFLAYEDKQCKWVKIPGVMERDIDMLRNYRLLTYPNKKNMCYIRRDDQLVEGNCSKANPNLYDEEFSDIVKDIHSIGLTDDISAESIAQSVCGITFKENKQSARIQKYLKFLDRNGPRFQLQNKDIDAIKQEQVSFKNQIDYEQKVQKTLNQEIARLDAIIKQKNDLLNSKNTSLKNINNIYAEMATIIKDTNKAIQNKQDEYDAKS